MQHLHHYKSAISLLLVLLTLHTKAQTSITRKGFVFGATVGGSILSLHDEGYGKSNQAGMTFPNLKFGYMISPKKALVLLLPGTVYQFTWQGRTRDRGFEAVLPSLQYWIKDRWWVLGGIGLGLDAPAFYDIEDETERKFYLGGASAVGTGYTLWHKGRFVVDMQGRVHVGAINVPTGWRKGFALSVGIGLNWY